MAFLPAIIPPEKHSESDLFFLFREDRLLVKIDDEFCSLPSFLDAQQLGPSCSRNLYIGTLNGIHCYAADLGDKALPAGLSLEAMRPLHGRLPEELLNAAGRAFEIVNWDRNHQYCGKCGNPTMAKADERLRLCPSCGFGSYPRITPVIIAAVVRDGRILLANHKARKNNMYSPIAGFVETGESFEECVRREVREEVNIEAGDIRYFGSQSWPFPSSIIAGFTARHESGEIKVDGIEIGDAGWFSPDKLPPIPPPYTISRRLIDWFVQFSRGRNSGSAGE
jgi:NAD+ diphosphatase